MTSSSGYPLHVNGWELHDNDAMMYWKESPEGYVFIDMTWMDITRSDPEYGTGKEYCVCTSIEETNDFDEAEESVRDLHHTDSYAISDIVSKADAEKIILDYIKEH